MLKKIIMNIKDIIKGATAKFSFYRNGMLYYEIIKGGKPTHIFPVNLMHKDKENTIDVKEIGSATFLAEYKAITLMRYIRKAIDNESIAEM